MRRKQKFDPELASEMEWSECVLASSIRNKKEDHLRTTWVCGACETRLTLENRDELTQTAQEFIDRGWRYRRTKKGMDALCPDCRQNSHK